MAPCNPENKHSRRLQQKRRNSLVRKIKQLSPVSNSYSSEKKIMECIPPKLLCVCMCAPICTHPPVLTPRYVGVSACACPCGGQRRPGDSNSSSHACQHTLFPLTLLLCPPPRRLLLAYRFYNFLLLHSNNSGIFFYIVRVQSELETLREVL